jgi:hypothetical protein
VGEVSAQSETSLGERVEKERQDQQNGWGLLMVPCDEAV